ncbi:hypothetical protein ABE424_17600 [Stenotrophomonas sp. TWI1149]|uniref:hypothetical protein n=1 Tax=unclassified Stenotrophomonas TaxID=196198 RepID=UPI00320B5265
MNKGIPYLLAALVLLTWSAGWAEPVLALFQHAQTCLAGGGDFDLLRLRCQPPPSVVYVGRPTLWFWLGGIVFAVVALLGTRYKAR